MERIQTALVLGVGVSGEAAAKLLLHHGAAVTVVDASAEAARGTVGAALTALGAHVIGGAVDLPEGCFDLCVVSPGIDQHSDWVQSIEARGVDVISELELGSRYCDAPIIAVTGTNGKSTLVKLLHDILMDYGLRSAIGGNYGIPLSAVVGEGQSYDWIVVEVSSFQLERIRTFRPRVGVLLNLQPDHLDRHGSMDAYRELKSRLFSNMKPGDVAIVHESELATVQNLVNSRNRWLSCGLSEDSDYFYRAGDICTSSPDLTESFDISESSFANPILGQAAAAALAVGLACDIPIASVLKGIRAFSGLPHRMQHINTRDGVSFIDDSKATNMAALKAAVEMRTGSIRLIAGGRLKEKNIEFVKEVLATNVACVYVIGEAAVTLAQQWGDVVPCVSCGDLKTAVLRAWQDAVSEGGSVLLSPGCASFDQFKSYVDRGEQFQKIVEELNEDSRHENIILG